MEHLQRRTNRLEFSTRYRPIHIRVLALAFAPPVRMEDYFYNDAAKDAEHSGEEQRFARAILEAAGIRLDGQPWKESLTEFQAAGWFVAYCAECPAEEWGREVGATDETISARFAPSAMLRIAHSYKPKWIVPVGAETNAFVPVLGEKYGDKIQLDNGRAFTPASLADIGASLR